MKRRPRKPVRVDPFYQEAPTEIVYNEQRRVIGEIYLLPAKVMYEGIPPKRRKSEK